MQNNNWNGNGNHFKVLPFGNCYFGYYKKLGKKAMNNACLTYGARIDGIKRSMTNPNATQEQFDELSKIESMYSELSRFNNKGKTSEK